MCERACFRRRGSAGRGGQGARRLRAAAIPLLLGLSSCLPDPASPILPPADLKPPLVLEAGPEGARSFLLRFDEAVEPVAGSFGLEPGPASPAARAEGDFLRLEFGAELEPGADYAVTGEAEDGAGNATRFCFSFAGWNGRPAALRLSEAQAAKNSSASRPHRDFLELYVEEAGNLGGVELCWANSAKRFSYRFRGVEVGAGEYLVLHLAPEGRAEEIDELGADLAASGGVDASPGARDFWCGAGGLPDASGAVALRPRPGAPVADALFYADSGKEGALGDDKLAALVAELGEAWPLGGAAAAWEDAFRWKPSTARSLCRRPGSARGAEAWYLGEASSQSPGGPNAPPGE